MNKIYILGNGGYAQEIFEQMFLQHNRPRPFGGFLILKDDKPILISDTGVEDFTYPKSSAFLLGTGDKKWRSKFIAHFTKYYELSIDHFPNCVSDKAHISAMAHMGIGNIFCAFSIVNGNANIGNFNNLNIYSAISHDCIIGNNNVLAPYAGIMGYVKAGDTNFIGAKAVIAPKVVIGSDNTISAGEVVFDDMTNRQFFQSGVIYNKP
jgi:UDP-3-O-[3-hydroxymyristoyl] glucosamine N-acyltransferase